MSEFTAMNWPAEELALALQPTLTRAPAALKPTEQVRQVQTDSRAVQADDLFVCLKGERFDAHDFAQQVVERGAMGLVTDRLLPIEVPQWVVRDTRIALGLLGKTWRARFDLPVMAVVGSNGKTTSKEMLACVARHVWKEGACCITEGNLNNDIGVPLTLLRLRATHQAAVVEMGMNHPGEMAYLAALVQPDAVLLTNAQREHQEFMKTLRAVALENGSAFGYLNTKGHAVFPAQTDFDSDWVAQADGARVLRFGPGGQAEVVQVDAQTQLRLGASHTDLQPRFVGRHNLSNAAGVAAMAWAMGGSIQDIAQGLNDFEPVAGRLKVIERTNRLTLIDDSYNANPDSVNAASQVLADLPGHSILVLGDMGEVGDQFELYHREVGEHAKSLGVGALYLLGEHTRFTQEAFGPGAHHFEAFEPLVVALKEALRHNRYNVLVKGSRFMKMERVIQALQAGPAQTDQESQHAA